MCRCFLPDKTDRKACVFYQEEKPKEHGACCNSMESVRLPPKAVCEGSESQHKTCCHNDYSDRRGPSTCRPKQQQTLPIPCSFPAAVEPVSEFAWTAYCPTALNRLLAPLPTRCTVQLRSPGNNLLSIRQVTTGRGLADQEHAQVDKGMTVFHISVYMLRIYTNPLTCPQ